MAAPELLAAPSVISQIIPTPAVLPSRVSGPLMSGDPSQAVVGSAILALPLTFDVSMGAFSMAIQLPLGSFPLWMALTTATAFDVTTTVSLGNAPGDASVLAATNVPAINVQSITPITNAGPSNKLIYINVNPGAATVGKATATLLYGRY